VAYSGLFRSWHYSNCIVGQSVRQWTYFRRATKRSVRGGGRFGLLNCPVSVGCKRMPMRSFWHILGNTYSKLCHFRRTFDVRVNLELARKLLVFTFYWCQRKLFKIYLHLIIFIYIQFLWRLIIKSKYFFLIKISQDVAVWATPLLFPDKNIQKINEKCWCR
jgi:hypothetical protein